MTQVPENPKNSPVTQDQEASNRPPGIADAALGSSETDSADFSVEDLPEAMVEASVDFEDDVLVLLDDDAIEDVTFQQKMSAAGVTPCSETTSVEDVALLKVNPEHAADEEFQVDDLMTCDGDLPIVEDVEDITSLVEETLPMEIEDDLDLDLNSNESSKLFSWKPLATAALLLLALALLPVLPDGSQSGLDPAIKAESDPVIGTSSPNATFEHWLEEVVANQLKVVTSTPEQG